MKNKLSLLAAAVLVSACATNPPPPPAPAGPSSTELRLTAIGDNTQRLLTQLVSLEQSRQAMSEPPKSIVEQLPADHPLMRKVTLTWRGDARVVLERLASQANLSVGFKGVSGTAPMVVVDFNNKPLAAVLENIGMQMGGVADLAYVDGEVPLIELRYRGQANASVAGGAK